MSLLYPPQTKFGGVYRNHPVCLSVCLSVRLSVRLSRVNLTLVITFQPIEIRLSYYTCWFLVTRPFCPYPKIWPVTLTLTFDLLLKKLNLGYNIWTKRDKASILHMFVPFDKTFLSIPKYLTLWPWPWLLTYFWKKLNLGYNIWTKRDKAFILHMLVPCNKTFLSVPKKLTLWPWPWLLTYFWKNLTLAITFEPREIRLSYYTCLFLLTRPFCPFRKIWPCDLDLWPTFEKNLTLAITFEPREIRLSYYRYVFLVARPFCPCQKFWPCDLDLDFWPTFEKNLTLAITFEPREVRLS